MNLMQANKQWSTRPADERFQTVQDMHDAVTNFKNSASEVEVMKSDLRVEAIDGDLKLVGKTGVPAALTHWSMGQISQQAGAPAGYLRELPATLAAQNINYGLKANTGLADKASLLIQNNPNGSLVLRGAVSEMYTRIWNSDITKRLLQLQQNNPNWKNPMGYNIAGLKDSNGNVPAMIPSGLYASDHDMFAFLVDESKTIEGSPKGLNRGFFTWNSEVGGKSYGFMGFYYDRVCGNNIVWGATDIFSLKIRHVGHADEKAFRNLAIQLTKYNESATGEIEKMIRKAKATEMGSTTEEILDNVFALAQKQKVAPILSQTRIQAAIETAASQRGQERYGNPNTLWSVVSGLTENSQTIEHMDKRLEVDIAAGKLLKVASF